MNLTENFSLNFTNPILIIILLIASIIVLYLYFTWTFDFWKNLNIPFRKPKIILGNYGDLLLFKKSQSEGIKEMYNWFKSARFFGVFRIRTPIFIVRDPDLVKHIYVKDFEYFINRGIPMSSQVILAKHLFNLEGNEWKIMRSKLTPLFSPIKMKNMFYLLVECEKVLEKLINDTMINSGNGGIADVRELAAKFTIDVIGSCVFGIEINVLSDVKSEFHKIAEKISRPSFKNTLWRMLRSSMPGLYKILRIQIIHPDVTQFFENIVSQIINEREQSQHVKRCDFLDLMIDLKTSSNFQNHNNTSSSSVEIKKIDENMIAAQAFVFFVAGFETSFNTIAFCLYELAMNPEIQEKVRQEISLITERHKGILNYDGLQEMFYLHTVMLETLRKYPPAPITSRRCEFPYQIPETKVQLPIGMRVVIPIYGIHHDPEYYPEPEKFDPNRFCYENRIARYPYTYLPFGEGPRNCIGKRFAMILTKVGIISFLKNKKLEICEKTQIPIDFSRRSLVTASENGIWLKMNTL